MSGVETRNIARDSLLLLAEARLDGASEVFRIKVRNLSGGGMMAEGQMSVVPGNHLQINLRNIGWVPGAVAWVQGDRCGIAFNHEIDPRRVRSNATAPEDRQVFVPSPRSAHPQSKTGQSDIRKI